VQVLEARASSAKLQLLLKDVANRKEQKQVQRQGLVILAAIYGDIKAYEKGLSALHKSAEVALEEDACLLPSYLDVVIPMRFLVDDSGQLWVCILIFTLCEGLL
jgi:DnaJ family protein C protein 11